MNLGAHVTIAAALSDDPVVHLGAALPDVATIGGFRMVPGAGTGAVGEGIALHHATDTTFHSHPWFTSRQKTVFDGLTAAGVGRGAARASAHVGVELLLDGELFAADTAKGPERSEAVQNAFGATVELHDPTALVSADVADRWLEHLGRLHRWRTPHSFRDPQSVAERMEQILEPRRRLAMEPADVDRVATALAAIQPSIAESAEEFLAEMVNLLR